MSQYESTSELLALRRCQGHSVAAAGKSRLGKHSGGTMQFGIFDQNDHGPYGLTEQYDKRLALIELYDRSGFRTYHMSEHHSTPLNLTSSPSVFLAAVAQRTKRLRFGALVYVLPAHHPLRLAEEIAMLDHLSNCLLYTSPSPRDRQKSRMPSSA